MMARNRRIVGNWKMNGTSRDLPEIRAIAQGAAACPGIDVALCVPFTLIDRAVRAGTGLRIGAQDVDPAAEGARTGCVSAAMVADAGACLTLVGHSERRNGGGDTDEKVAAKLKAAHGAGLEAVLCVGETRAEREAGTATDAVATQLARSLGDVPIGDWLAIAYEPVWAIGSATTPAAAEIARMHRAIRAHLTRLAGPSAVEVRLLYGGSVTAVNAAEILICPDVDGVLVGGASLTATSFLEVIEMGAHGATATDGIGMHDAPNAIVAHR